MKLLLSIFIASFYGLTIRLLFSTQIFELMSYSFFFIVPFLIGYLTIFLIPYKENQSAALAFFKPWLTILVILVITIKSNIEGNICWAMAYPIFAVIAGIGGSLAFNRKKRRAMSKQQWDFEKDEWDKPGSLKTSLLLLIPVFTGLLEGNRLSSDKAMTVAKTIEINAAPALVWKAMLSNDQRDIKEHHLGLTGIFGFPHHLNTTLDSAAVGGSRVANYEKGLSFQETIQTIEPGRSLLLQMRTDPEKISKAVMDEHIVIGGKHIQLQQDEYQLQALPGGKTRLSLSSRFNINTTFNWYAGLWANLMLSDILTDELNSVKQICEL